MMSGGPLQYLADKLYDQWNNGSLTEVLETIEGLPSLEAAIVAVELAGLFLQRNHTLKIERLVALMEDRI